MGRRVITKSGFEKALCIESKRLLSEFPDEPHIAEAFCRGANWFRQNDFRIYDAYTQCEKIKVPRGTLIMHLSEKFELSIATIRRYLYGYLPMHGGCAYARAIKIREYAKNVLEDVI